MRATWQGTELLDVEEWLVETAAYKRLNVIGVKAISSRTGDGIFLVPLGSGAP